MKSKIGLLGGKIRSQRAVNWWKRPERGKLSNLSKKPRLSVVRANFGGSGAKRKLEAHNQVHHKCCALHFLFFSCLDFLCILFVAFPPFSMLGFSVYLFCIWFVAFPLFPCLGFLCICNVFGLWHSPLFTCLDFLCIFYVFGLWHFPPFPCFGFLCICNVFGLWHFPPFPACICCVFVLFHFPFFQLGLSVYVFVYLVFVALWQT